MTSDAHARRNHTGGLLTVAAAVVAVIMTAGPASAATAPAPAAPDAGRSAAVTECAAGTGDAAAPTTGPEMVRLEGPASDDMAATATVLAEDAGATQHSPAASLDREGVKVYAIDVEGAKATSVTFPLTGDGLVQPSNLTYVVDEGGELAQYSESTVIEGEDGSLEVTTYRDGALVHSASLDAAAQPTGLLADASASASAADPTTCLAAVLGVSAVVAGVILVLCGGSCSVPFTPPTAVVCAACIGGFAVVGGASIAAVMGCFD
ncbi:hypothetical protein [Clavibacter sp. Sh2088]|uniref:hypothetical protein n=1 Tax=Clavibacter sp. Sh2088 TaxID=3397676 RepID=UPI0039E0937E